MPPVVQRLTPSMYQRQPWKNGGGITTTIAQQFGDHGGDGGWSNLIWQLGRTQIVSAGAFSDLSGFERLQVVVGGRGLVLVTPAGDIDVRSPFTPVRYDGGTPIVSRLEDGPVDVVNLIARKQECTIDLAVIREGDCVSFSAAEHIVYAPSDNAHMRLEGTEMAVSRDHAVRFTGKATVTCIDGLLLVCSIAVETSAS